MKERNSFVVEGVSGRDRVERETKIWEITRGAARARHVRLDGEGATAEWCNLPPSSPFWKRVGTNGGGGGAQTGEGCAGRGSCMRPVYREAGRLAAC